MNSIIGDNVKQYRNVILRSSTVGDNSILADDVFITDSNIGKFCTVERRGMIFNSDLGDYSYTGYNTVVKYTKIGKFCSISWNVSIGGANHDFTALSTHPFPIKKKYGISEETIAYDSFAEPLTIGNDVWIGSNVSIMRGVKIGDGAVIGAGSVVTKDVPPYAIAYGNPAKVHKFRFDKKIIDLIKSWQWWDWPEDLLKDHVELFRHSLHDEDIEKLNTIYETIGKTGIRNEVK